MATVSAARPPSSHGDESQEAASSALDALPSEARNLGVQAMRLIKLGDFHGAIAALNQAIEIEGDSWILWKHVALTHFELWKHVASSRATPASTWFLAKHSGGSTDPLELFLRNAYDMFIVAMEYRENKHNPSMLLKLATLYVEYESFQGALALCTLVLESTKATTFRQYHECVFLSAIVAKGLRHSTQSGEYFAYLVDTPPYKMHSYRLLVLAGMQFDCQTESADALERSRVLYTEAYKRLTSIPILSPTPAEKRALEMYRTSRKSESERIQSWIGDAALWESLAIELFYNNHPFLAATTFEYAIARGGCQSVEVLVELGRVYHRLHRTEQAQRTLEQSLRLNYWNHPTRFWLGAVSFPWSQHFKREERGALAYQRVYRGHRGRQYAKLMRHQRAQRLMAKLLAVSRIWWRVQTAKVRVAVRKAEELAREEAERGLMHLEDWFLVYLRWNAAARKIQSLVPIYQAKKEKQRRRAWMERHKALLRRVVSNSLARLVQTCFASMIEFLAMVREEKWHASTILQRNIRAFLCRRRLDRLRTKHETQQKLLTSFLGKTKSRWKRECFMALRTNVLDMKSLRTSSAVRIQCCYRAFRARREFRKRMAHHVRVRSFMVRVFASRDQLAMRQTFNALATSALAARLHKHACATRIQKIARGRQGRTVARRMLKRHRHCEMLVAKALVERARRAVDRSFTQWQLFVQVSQMEKQRAAVLIQRMERGRQARRRVKLFREYRHVFFGYPLTFQVTQRRLVFVALWKCRQFRQDCEHAAACTIQRAVRRVRRRRMAKRTREKLKKKMHVAQTFQKTFHATARAFFDVLKQMRADKMSHLNHAARVIQRNLRGWLARRVFARKAAQHRQASSLLQRVRDREKRYWLSVVLRLWKEGVVAKGHEKNQACIRIQRRFRARQATKQARKIMDKRARQRRLMDNAMSKPLARSFQQWEAKVLERTIATFEAARAAKHSPFSMQSLDSQKREPERGNGPSSMLFYHVLTKTRRAGVCHLPQGHGFHRHQLVQLFQLATSVISDAGGTSSSVLDALAFTQSSPVQKLIIYSDLRLDLTKLVAWMPTHHLTSLVLGNTMLSVRHITALAVYLADPTAKLQQLVLESCCIGNSGALALAMALRHNQSLWKLDLSRNHIGDAACRALSEALLQNDALQVLALNYNNLSDNAVLGYMEPAMSSLPSSSALESLQLQGNNRLTARGLDALQAAIKLINARYTKRIRLEVDHAQSSCLS